METFCTSVYLKRALYLRALILNIFFHSWNQHDELHEFQLESDMCSKEHNFAVLCHDEGKTTNHTRLTIWVFCAWTRFKGLFTPSKRDRGNESEKFDEQAEKKSKNKWQTSKKFFCSRFHFRLVWMSLTPNSSKAVVHLIDVSGWYLETDMLNSET